MQIVQFALDKLANSIRIYAESSVNFPHLSPIDSEEAINNLDRSFDAMLEAFHSLYDLTKNEFSYFEHADLALLIIIRNAVHHRDHLLFRSWNSEMHLNGGIKKYSGAAFLFANYQASGEARYSEYYLKISDIYERIETCNKIQNKAKTLSLLENNLRIGEVVDFSDSNKYPLSQVYLNIIPVFVAAIKKLFQYFQENGVVLKGFDSKVYADFFIGGSDKAIGELQYKTLRIQ